MDTEISPEQAQLDNLKAMEEQNIEHSMDEGAPLYVWKNLKGTAYFVPLEGINSMNCDIYARRTCKTCWGKGFTIYSFPHSAKTVWRQACDCVRRKVETLNKI